MIAFDAMLAAAKLVSENVESKATGGTVTTLIDTTLGTTKDDWWNGGVVFVRSGTYNANTALEVLDYTESSKTLIVSATNLAHAIASDNRYTLIRGTYHKQALLDAVNMALTEIGAVSQTDDTLLVTADTEEYDLPAGVSNVVRVQVGGSASEPYTWETLHYWREMGTKLIFPNGKAPTSDGMPLRLIYNAPHAVLTADSDSIDSAIHPTRLAWLSGYHAVLERVRLVGADDQKTKDLMALMSSRVQEMAARFPVRRVTKLTTGSGL